MFGDRSVELNVPGKETLVLAKLGANPGGGRAGKPGGGVTGELSKCSVELSKCSVELSLLVRPAGRTWLPSGQAVCSTASSERLRGPCWHVLACIVEI